MTKDYMKGHCHVMALAIKRLCPKLRIRARIIWNEEVEDTSEYTVDHVYVIDPITGKAYDHRGSFLDENVLVGRELPDWEQNVDFPEEEIRRAVKRGELKKYTEKDIQEAFNLIKQKLCR